MFSSSVWSNGSFQDAKFTNWDILNIFRTLPVVSNVHCLVMLEVGFTGLNKMQKNTHYNISKKKTQIWG